MKILTVDVERCTGCRLCEAACSLRFDSRCRPSASRIAVVRFADSVRPRPSVCRHCADPPCAAVCPTEALVRDEATGAVLHLRSRCIGCFACAQACPFGAVGADPETGDPVKCDLCGGDPACVPACPQTALRFEAPAVQSARRRRVRARRDEASEREP